MFKINLSDPAKYRLLEIIPGGLAWLTFAIALILSFVKPLWVIYFIIIFTLYWIVRISYLMLHVLYSWLTLRKSLKIDWQDKVKAIPGWDQYYHLIFLPTYKEGIEVIRHSFNCLNQIKYPLKNLIVVLGGEERDKDNFLKYAETIKQEFGDKFFKLLVTVHPKGLPEEIPGKGSNLVWMGNKVKEFIDTLEIPYEKIIASAFDIDSCVYPQYFSYLTYKYITHRDPTHTSFQPVAFYHNNIWDAPAFLRVVANSTTFWLLTELVRPERLFTFSSHSMSFKALVDVGFWEKDVVTEDSRIFLQCFDYYQGNYQTEPMFIPVSMDTVLSSTFKQSLINQYKQVRRWGWSIEHFPYMMWHFFIKKNQIPFWKKIKYMWNFAEGSYSWVTAPILLLVLGHLPMMLADKTVKATVIAQNAPFVLQNIMTIGMAGIIIYAILSTIILPKPTRKLAKYKYILMVLQWIFLPITMILFGSIPALDAQTRMMLGKRMGFDVTEKVRKVSAPS